MMASLDAETTEMGIPGLARHHRPDAAARCRRVEELVQLGRCGLASRNPRRHVGGLRGPRAAEEMAVQEELFPGDAAVPFGPAEVALASRLSKPLHAPGGARTTRGRRLRARERRRDVDAQPSRLPRHSRAAPHLRSTPGSRLRRQTRVAGLSGSRARPHLPARRRESRSTSAGAIHTAARRSAVYG